MKVQAILTKPLDGMPEGAQAEYEQNDFDALERMGAVKKSPSHSNKMDAAPQNKAKPAVKQA